MGARLCSLRDDHIRFVFHPKTLSSHLVPVSSCILNLATIIDHAFDANSLNGLAGKIIKGRYPPVNAKYSRHLRDLIGQLLLTNPQQRPDTDQILRKPFIKKHIVNFFTDIASRPMASLGEGTMIVRAAAGGSSNGALDSDVNMISLRQQLDMLDMTKDVMEALNPKPPPVDPLEAKKLAKEQASALRREEEHKQMVEAALEKLRLERESRAKLRQGIAPQRLQFGRDAKGGPPSGYTPPANVPLKAAAFRQPQRGPSQAALDFGGAKREGGVREGGGLGRAAPVSAAVAPSQAEAADRRRRGQAEQPSSNVAKDVQRDRRLDDRDKRRQSEQDAKDRAEDKRREDVRAEAKAREEARLRGEALVREEALAKQRRDQLLAQQEAAQKRELLRDRERERQRDEIDQLKKDKQELDRRARDRERLREERRAEERRKLDDERERERLSDISDDKVSSSRISSEDYEKLSARDRVLLRKQERLAREEAERKEALKTAENENRRLRLLAQEQGRNQFHPNAVAPNPSQAPKVSVSTTIDDDEAKNNNGPAGGRRSKQVQSSSSNEGMALNELSDRLREVTDGQGR